MDDKCHLGCKHKERGAQTEIPQRGWVNLRANASPGGVSVGGCPKTGVCPRGQGGPVLPLSGLPVGSPAPVGDFSASRGLTSCVSVAFT